MDIIDVTSNDVSVNEYVIQGSDFYGYALDTFDRVISGIPPYYGYYGIVNDSDAYLYFGSENSVNGLNIAFGADCKEVHFYDDGSGNFQIENTASPGASFLVGTSDICYTNLISGFPTLGDSELSFSGIAALFLVSSALIIVFNRSRR